MAHPFLGLSSRQRHHLFWLTLGLTVLAMAVLQIIDAPLKTAAAPLGVVSFALAGTSARATAILQSWDAHARLHAAFSLGFDYLFMLAYASAIALAALWVGEGDGARLGEAAAWGAGLAGVADAAENHFLWRLLLGVAPERYPFWARWAAMIKFAILAAALGYVCAALVIRMLRKR